MPLDLFPAGQRGASADAAMRPGWGPGLDVSFGEGFGSAWQAAAGTFRLMRVQQKQHEIFQKWIDDFEAATGFAPANPEIANAPSMGIGTGVGPGAYQKALADLRKAYDAEKLKNPDFAMPAPPTRESAYAAAITAERELAAADAAVGARPQTFGSQAGSVLGSFAGVVVDPLNLAAIIAGASTGGIAAVALREALIGAASQTAISALTLEVNRAVDPDYGLGDVALEITAAAAGGALIGGGIRALGRAWEVFRARSSTRQEGEPPLTGYVVAFQRGGRTIYGRPGEIHAILADRLGLDIQAPVGTAENLQDGFAGPDGTFLTRQEMAQRNLPESGEELIVSPVAEPDQPDLDRIPRNVLDAGNVVSRESGIAETSPLSSAGAEGEVAHADLFKQAEKAIVEGRPLELPQNEFAGGTWRPARVFASDGTEVGVRYEVVEADTLVASQRADLSSNPDYPAELQPRDRTRAASTEQIAEISSRLNPERLGPSSDAATGAPIVGPDDVIESGNGRWLALKTAYQTGRADGYRDFLARSGFETTGIREPILVARRTTPLEGEARVAFTTAANRATTLNLSAPEQALADARLLDTPLLAKIDPEAPLTSPQNLPFIRGMLGKLPQAERGGLIDRRGNLSVDGIRRAQAALLARAYGDPALLSKALESPDNNIKALAGSLTDVASRWAVMRDAVARGDLPASMDITGDLLAAVRLVQRARDERVKPATLVDQAQMFETTSQVTKALLRLMFRDADLTRAASQKAVSRGLTGYADEALKNTTDARLFGEPLEATDVLTTSLAKAGREDLALAAEEATLPTAATERMVEPDVEDAVLHRLEQLMPTERIEGAAVRIDGEIFRGNTHAEALDRASGKLGIAYEDLVDRFGPEGSEANGFVTSEGRFVSRAEATEIDEAARRGELTIPIRSVDEFGQETVTMRPVRELIAEADDEIAAAREIEACAMPMQVAAE